MTTPPKDRHHRTIEGGLKALPIGLDPKIIRSQPAMIGNAVVAGDNGVTMDRVTVDHARRVPPVALVTSATTFCAVASISSSVRVRSAG